MAHRSTRIAFVGIVLAATVGASFVQDAAAETSRRSARRSQPVPLSRTSPDTTATIPTAKPKPPIAAVETQDLGESLPARFELPVAPRSRMRACGLKWQAVKMSGQVGTETWREFATKCLVERDEAAKATGP